MEYTHGAMIAFAGRNEGLALDNQLSNCELSSRAKISQRKINKRFNFMSKNTGIVWRSLPNIMHLTQSFHTTVRIPVSWMTSSTCRHNTSITDVLNSAQKWKNILSTKEITKKKKIQARWRSREGMGQDMSRWQETAYSTLLWLHIQLKHVNQLIYKQV